MAIKFRAPRLGSKSPAGRLLNSFANETSGMVIDFVNDQMLVRDPANPVNNFFGSPKEKLIYNAPSPKLTEQSNGFLAFQAHNLFTWSEDFSNAIWTVINCTKSGTEEATITLNVGSASKLVNQAPTWVNGAAGRFAVEAKAGTHTIIQLYNVTSVNHYANFDLLNGTVGTVGSGISSATITATTDGYYLCSIEWSSSTGGNCRVYGVTDTTSTAGLATSSAGTYQLRKPHLHRLPSSMDYIKTTTAAGYFLPYVYSGGVCTGFQNEPTSTNLCLYANDFSNANWKKTNVTATLTATGPDGVANSASVLTATSDGGSAHQRLTASSGSRSTSIYMKRRTGTGNIAISQGGTTIGNELVTNGTFDSDISGWTAFGTSLPTLSHTGSALLITNTGTTSTRGAGAAVPCVPGKVYRVSATCTASSGTVVPRIHWGTTLGGIENGLISVASGTSGQACFVASANIMYVGLSDSGVSASSTLTWDNVSVLEINPVVVDLSSGNWVRAKVENETLTNPAVFVYLSTSGDAVDVYGAQNEALAFTTSPILTYGSSIVRAADSTEITTSLFPYNITEGTIHIKAIVPVLYTGARFFSLNNNSSTIRVLDVYCNSNTTILGYKTIDAQTFTCTSAGLAGENRVSFRYKQNDYHSSYNGTLGAADTSTGSMQTATMFEIGNLTGSSQLSMTVQQVAYFPTARADAELQSLGA